MGGLWEGKHPRFFKDVIYFANEAEIWHALFFH